MQLQRYWERVYAMPELKTIQSYLNTVAEQIRWKRARPVLVQELARHMEDQKDAFASEGLLNAEDLTVKEMGDPVSVGLELDRVHRPKPQWSLLLFTVFLALAGAGFRIWLTSTQGQYYTDIDPIKTILALVMGCGALILGYFIDCSRIGHHAGKVYLGALLVGILVLLLTPKANYASYYTKYVVLCFPVVYAIWLYACRMKKWFGLIFAILGGVPLLTICTLAPHAFGLTMLLLTGFVLLIVAAANDWFGIGKLKTMIAVSLAGLSMLGMTVLGVLNSNYGIRRLEVAFHPEQDALGIGYQAYTIRKALSVSQWLGEGKWSQNNFGVSYETTVPGCDSDALLTTLIYKLGWFPFIIVVLALILLVGWLLYRCLKQKNQLGRMIALSVVMTLSIQAFCSVLWNLGYTLFSASFPLVIGNLNTVINMWLIGLALSVFRGESIARDSLNSEMPPLPRYRIKIVVQKI